MADSTLQDIYDNRDALITKAKELLVIHAEHQPYEMDDWYSVTVGDLEFDLNVFEWELKDETPLVIVTAHTVETDEHGNVSTNRDEWVRLITKIYNTITEEI